MTSLYSPLAFIIHICYVYHKTFRCGTCSTAVMQKKIIHSYSIMWESIPFSFILNFNLRIKSIWSTNEDLTTRIWVIFISLSLIKWIFKTSFFHKLSNGMSEETYLYFSSFSSIYLLSLISSWICFP